MERLIVWGLAGLVLGLLLSGCARMPMIDTTLGQHLPCSVGPIILDKSDQLSRRTAEQIVALDEAGARLCDWKPPAK